jgi:valyl-tRNA synthetase
MPHELPKAYEPGAIETRWAEYWIKEKLFSVPTPPEGETLPPPNVTGNLHMGHMLEHTEIDIIVRWKRMSGLPTLWLPGTDHAGIATQLMVERQLASEGKNRRDMGREAFIARVWDWKQHYGGVILQQMKRLGASVDWSREYFTMDDRMSRAVREAFVRLYEEGLIYRGKYIVNWCPRCITAVSDLEVVHEDTPGKIWEIRYPIIGSKDEHIIVATTRPETMLGDTAVAVNSADERYRHLHGKHVLLAADESRDPDHHRRHSRQSRVRHRRRQGHAAHDPNDFEAGLRNNLPQIDVMNEVAQMNDNAGPYKGLDRFEARTKILADLEAGGFWWERKITWSRWASATAARPSPSRACRRSGSSRSSRWPTAPSQPSSKARSSLSPRTTPRLTSNGCATFTTGASRASCGGDIAFPRGMQRVRRDHRGARSADEVHEVRRPGGAGQPTSSTPGSLQDCCRAPRSAGPTARPTSTPSIPTALLITGFDILFFWVARMIMMNCHFMRGDQDGDVPFRTVHIHGLVRDAERQKMSKTKGNVMDPIEIIEKYGTDAVRFTMAAMVAPGGDIAFSESRTESYRAFANKIWNAARFLFMNVDRDGVRLVVTGGI